MARNISVKVPVTTLVASIENKIAEIDEAIANYPALYEKYEADIQAYKTKVAEFVSDYLSKNVARIGYDYSDPIRISTAYNGRVELTFDKDIIEGFPERPIEPKKPNSQTYYGREYTSQRELLERNLKILRMTSQEEVNASTYGAILELL